MSKCLAMRSERRTVSPCIISGGIDSFTFRKPTFCFELLFFFVRSWEYQQRSLSFDVEKISDDITEPTGLIGQFLSEISYEIDEEHNIITK